MTEDELLRNVLELCSWLGITTAHFRPARTEHGWRTAVQGDGKGFPDLVLVGRRLIFRELKSATGQLDRHQRWWRDKLLNAGEDWGLWRPKHWTDGAIRAELDALVNAAVPIRGRSGADPAHHNGTGRDIGEWAGLDLDLTEGKQP